MAFSLADLSTATGSLKPENIGDTIAGTITDTEVRQVNAYETGQPEFWDNGEPKLQAVISLRTDTLDANGKPETGSVYVKWWGSQRAGLIAAANATGLSLEEALKPGNRLTVTYSHDEPAKNPRFNATKIYTYRIDVAANPALAALDTTTQTAAPATVQAPATIAPPATAQAPAPATQPATQPATAQAPAQPDPAALIAAGLTDDQIAAALGIDQSSVAIIRQTLA